MAHADIETAALPIAVAPLSALPAARLCLATNSGQGHRGGDQRRKQRTTIRDPCHDRTLLESCVKGPVASLHLTLTVDGRAAPRADLTEVAVGASLLVFQLLLAAATIEGVEAVLAVQSVPSLVSEDGVIT